MLAVSRGAAQAASIDYRRLVYPYLEKEMRLATPIPLERLCRLAHVISSPAAWQALETVRCVEMQIGDRTKLGGTRGSRQAAEVLKILHLAALDPPKPIQGEK